jgi:hypothetical protein
MRSMIHMTHASVSAVLSIVSDASSRQSCSRDGDRLAHRFAVFAAAGLPPGAPRPPDSVANLLWY